MTRPMVADQPASERLMQSMHRRRRTQPPTQAQVAEVLHALADHTALQLAVNWRSDEDDTAATCLARWFHAVADDLERGDVRD